MKKKVQFHDYFCYCFLMSLILFSCSQNKEIIPSSEYAPYINAFTGGSISSQSTIKIEFAQEQPVVELNIELKDELFKFSPSIKGKTYWINNRTVEFVPDSGQLKQGTLYNASFRLGKVMNVEKKLSKFAFSFRVTPQNFGLEMHPYFVDESNPEVASIEGILRFGDRVNLEQVKKMVLVEIKGDHTHTVKIEPTPVPTEYGITIENIKRDQDNRTLNIYIDGALIGVDRKIEESVRIPALKPFCVLNARLITEPENGIGIVFSDPLSSAQDLRGLINIQEISDYVFQKEGNIVNVFFEKGDLKEFTVRIDKAVQNYKGESLSSETTYSLVAESLKPRVEIANPGSILPDSKNLILPFKSVNIRAVDLQIIRIYEKNVLMFMQSNTLSSDNELRRSGRLIYRKTIPLDTDPGVKLDKWNHFSIDLADVINQEPGAIYRIQLSFKKEYSLYLSNHDRTGFIPDESLARIDSDALSEEDEAVWDIPQTYYWSGNEIDWEEYDWNDRNDPSKSSYYMLAENTKTACNVLASDVGVIVKANTGGKLWVVVNNILNTNPLKGAKVKAYNFQLQVVGSSETDGDGFAMIELKGKPFILTAESGNQKAYLRLVDGEEKSLSRFDVGGKETQKGMKGFVFGERGVWRPGDTLHIGFILEDKLRKIPDSHPVSIEIYNPKGQFYTKQTSINGLNGFHVFHISTDPDDITGVWNAYVKVGGASFHKSLRIEAIKPNRLKVNLDIPVTRLDASKGSVRTILSSNWLTGTKASGLKAAVEMSLAKVATQFKGYEKYVFNNPASSFYTDKIDVFKGNLNVEGNAGFDLKLPEAQNAPGMLQATFISRVFEPGGDVSTFVQSMPFSPFSAYVGINVNQTDEDGYIETDQDKMFDIVTLNSDGKPVDRQNIEYKVYKIGWSWWWESNTESLDAYINGNSKEPVLSENIASKGGKARIKFRVDYPDWGRYLVYVKDKESGHATGKIVYVDWPSWRGRSMKTDPNGITMLSFSTDKKSYEVGEEVTVIIPKASKGRALVALENGTSVISRSWVDVENEKDSKYKFKVTEEMAPNFYIHVSLLQPHAQTTNDMPIRLYGVVSVMVTNKNSTLHPVIEMPEMLRPEKEFTVKVKEKSGRPMTYTLAIVDEGLLDLTAFKTPDPWNEFYSREALGIRTWDIYDYVIGAFGGKFSSLFSIGGDEALKPVNEKANRFKPVVKFLGPFAIKKGETGTHKLQLPPYVGSVRTMVVAEQSGAYGNVEKTVPVKNPLMILPTLPRVMSVGEDILLPVNVFAMENSVKNVVVKVETLGLSKVIDSSSKPVKFSKIGDEIVYFSLKVGTQTGVEKVKVTATGNGESVTETIEIQVRNPNPAVIEEVSQLLSPGQEEIFSYNLKENSNESWVKLEVSRIPSVDINRRFDYLNDYQHCCSEQLVSKAFPLLYIDQFKNLDEKEKDRIGKNVREAIRRLYGRQLQSGGFAYWPGQTSFYAWINSYVGHFLVEARKKGYDVNEQVLNRWKSLQRTIAMNWQYETDHSQSRYLYSQEDLQQAYRLYTLVLAGVPEYGAMNRLKELQGLSQQARWRLAAAYALDGKKDIANELIFNVEAFVNPYSSSNATYGSYSRDEAMVLETLVLLNNMPKALEQAKRISKNLSSESYFSTQSTAYSLMAMGEFANKMGKGMIEADWSLNGKSRNLLKTAKAVTQIDIPSDKTAGMVKLKNMGTGNLYVSLTSKFKPLKDTLPVISNNLRLEVSYADMNGHSLDVSSIKQGTDFIARIKVVNISGINDYADLALTQIIPSGWEIFNERMMRGEGEITPQENYSFRDVRDDRIFTYFDLRRSEVKIFKVRLQAAYAGKYILPAVQCEAMYDTQTQGRTKASQVEVIK
ncbi:MAG: alpha-2-macroglobulin [Dysgonamonadaceae bacterium]|jgi:uncharacterized protein YfaS (alpha-2-macroglobulin family)|nr:alpha-2-macroglobulin [Dysgonamonadaceae bacterium]